VNEEKTMKKRELMNLGIPKGEPIRLAMKAASDAAHTGMDKKTMRDAMKDVVRNPDAYMSDPVFGQLARSLNVVEEARSRYAPREAPAPWRQWGAGFEAEALQQMVNACNLPVSVRGALMPDAHVGYGLPIGGVLAVDNAVIPYAVGVDIACRMKMTVLDLPVQALTGQQDRLRKALEEETRFGIGAEFRKRREHRVIDEDWTFSPVVASFRDKAWAQLGTSGSGNHFAEFGTLTFERDDLGMKAGVYLALLSHSGSRGTGNEVARYYSQVAMKKNVGLPKELTHLAWLGLDTHEGQEYWLAMELMGRYAAANHEIIHRCVARNLGVDVLLDIENHHNFAWKEEHDGREVIVHRKGATPAGKGDLGIIPGSMATPGFLVRGRGVEASLNSASHGAGRKMSRKAATQQYTWHDLKKLLTERGVTLISAGIDEVPMAYKNIETVMDAQSDLVEIIARFDPKLVKMSPAGERPED
jgi:tRNA-splicing ligase RtcB